MTHRFTGRAPHRRALPAWTLALASLACLAWVAVPMVLIRPFSPQTPRGIAVAYALRSWHPVVPPALLCLGLVAAVALGARLASSWTRAVLLLPVALLGGLTWLSRQNHFEWMFAPLRLPEFVAAGGSHGVGPEDMVLGVARGDDACAYPVRTLAYHHVVNAVVDGDALVATY